MGPSLEETVRKEVTLGKVFRMRAMIPAVVAAALAAGVKTYDHLSGRNLLLDALDRFRLATRSLEEGDNHWASNIRRSDIVVCLTTTPARIGWLEGTLKTLLLQSCSPARIRLHLPAWSKREERAYEIPAFLEKLRAVQVVRCHEWGPATKLIPALAEFPPQQRLLVVDDDMLYPADLVANFHAWSEANPHLAIASSGWIVPADLTDRPTTLWGNLRQAPPVPLKSTRIREPRRVDVFQGYSGYLVRPSFFDHAEVTDYTHAPPEAFWVDDVWLSGHCKVRRVVFPARRYCFEQVRLEARFKHTGLGRINRGDGTPEMRNNTIVIRALRDRWMVSRGSA